MTRRPRRGCSSFFSLVNAEKSPVYESRRAINIACASRAALGAKLSSTYETAHQGLFSYWLMKGPEGDSDNNQDQEITAGELYGGVAKHASPMLTLDVPVP